MDENFFAQSASVSKLWLSDLSEQEKLNQILTELSTETVLQPETFLFLVQEIGTHLHSDFWFSLHQIFPNDGEVTFAAANADLTSLNADLQVYGPLFILGIKQTGDVYQVGNEVGAMLLESPYRFDFQLLFLEAALKDWAIYPADAEEEINEMLGEYPFDALKIKQIQRLIEQYTLPQ